MAYHGDWPKALAGELKKCWQKAKGDRDEFKKLVLADKMFKEKGWNACERKARRMGLFKKAKMSKRYVFQLTKGQLEEVKKMLADDNTGYQEVIQKCSEFNLIVTKQQLRSLAKGEGIKLNKERPGRKAAETEPETPEAPEATEKQLIKQREAREISIEEFLDGLRELGGKSDLWRYWEIFSKLLTERRVLRNTELLPFAEELGWVEEKKDKRSGLKHKRERALSYTRGVLDKFVLWEALSKFKEEAGEESYEYYLCDLPGFYGPDELAILIPAKDAQLVLDALGTEKWTLGNLAEKVEKVIGTNLLETLLEHYVSHQLITKTGKPPKTAYRASGLAKLVGLDTDIVELLRMENELILRRLQEANMVEFKDYSEIVAAQKELVSDLAVPTFALGPSAEQESVKIVFLCEPLHGYIYTAAGFLEKMMKIIEKQKDSPDITITTGLVLGNFLASQILRALTLNPHGFLDHIYAQFQAASLVLTWAERVTKNLVFYVLGDDDKRTGQDYALVARAAEKQGPQVKGFDLSPEASRWLKDRRWLNKCLIQWTTIWPYQYRILRTLKNKQEMIEYAKSLGVEDIDKSEYYLIVFIHWAGKFDKPIPENYLKVINEAALFGEEEKKHILAV